jgi:ATP-binding cassette subfamily C protein EexD
MMLLLASSGGFEWVRSKLLIAANMKLEQDLRERVSQVAFRSTLLSGNPDGSAQALNDLLSLRQFATGAGIFALMDAPWVPIYIAVMFIFHPLFGIAAIFTTVILLCLAFITQKSTGKRLESANSLNRTAQLSFLSNLRNAEVIHGMGMAGNIRAKDAELQDQASHEQSVASAVAGRLAAISKSFRLICQSLLLGLGAYLALRQEISPGMMIAGSLLLGRALAPIDMLVGTWKSFVDAKDAFTRLRAGLKAQPDEPIRLSLPPPVGELSVEQLVLAPPGSRIACVKGISFKIAAGEALGIVGPSAAGKTSLIRGILGVWPIASGSVRLDGAEISSWNREELGPYLGYLPQDIELFDGSIAENICRFSELNSDKVIAAAKTAGIHDMILRLSDGYETKISSRSGALSAGQRQRVGLARAIYGQPKLIILDEPNSNLDDQGEKDLLLALRELKGSGSTVIVVSHRTSILALVDKLALVKEGVIGAFGNRDDVLKAISEAQSKITKLPSQASKRT